MKIVGVDFTSAPKRDKRISVAVCRMRDDLDIEQLLDFSDWPAYELWLGSPDEWVGGFDFPFGLPKRFVERQKWSLDWPEMIRACVYGGKENFSETAMKAFLAARSDEDKHRGTDLVAGSHSPLKTKTNPPVGKMFYEGTWRLLANHIHVPRMNETDSRKTAVEAYPGLLARQIGFRQYKNDKPATFAKNSNARRTIAAALETGSHPLGLRVRFPAALKQRILKDSSGDTLDSVLCAVQAAWGAQRPGFGLPAKLVPCEGWIVSAGG